MTKKEFETLAIVVFGLSLLYVPTELCVPMQCISMDWAFITSLDDKIKIDLTRLVIQELVISIFIFAIWNYKYKD